MSSHAGKVVLVTGAGQGIGRAIADAHAAAGAAVAYLDHDLSRAEVAAREAAAGGAASCVVGADVADEQSVKAAVAEAVDRLGPVTVLINNAGISPKTGEGGRRGAKLGQMSAEEWRRVVDVNLTGAFLCASAVVPFMKAAGYGAIVNVSSVAGKTFFDVVGVHYAATKAALIGFTKHLAGELGPDGITVNAVAPGRIDTPLMRGASPEANEAARMATPLRRLGQPQDVAEMCLFLTSDSARFVTAQVCDVAGGWMMT